ncbi:hypothetical protein B0H16DRAFT_1808436 [Mycena metata]|uniref:Uncharacterized protein n=1 Tax=Mycena metata TaxID=1033252 RepID=A0AAD7JF82_9AGAR|nr:hypothetical protein B0H16DRAFT_1808436 [Mycena metata]
MGVKRLFVVLLCCTLALPLTEGHPILAMRANEPQNLHRREDTNSWFITPSPVVICASAHLSKRAAKVSVVAIAGGAAAGIAVVLALTATVILYRTSSWHRGRASTATVEESPLHDYEPSPQFAEFRLPPEQDDPAALAAEVRHLRAQILSLDSERSENRSTTTVGSHTGSSISRSLSAMKREQTQKVQEYQQSRYKASDEVLHADRGFWLTPGREEEDSAPIYAL